MLLIVRLLTVLVLAATIMAIVTGDRFGIGLGVLLVAVCLVLLRRILRNRG